MYASYITTLYQAAAASLDPALKDFETQFAPIPPPPNDEWIGILLSVVSLVGTVAVSAVFNSSMYFYHSLPVSTPKVCCCM
jgi:hypothetical protein